METKLKTRTQTQTILILLNVVAWVALIGFVIKAGAILISFGVSFLNPGAAKNLYLGLDLHQLLQHSWWQYTVVVSFWVGQLFLKAYTLFLVTGILAKVSLMSPFTAIVARKLETLSQVFLGAWVLALLHNAHVGWLMKRTAIALAEWPAQEFLIMAGVVFVISQVFKRGVEIQSENELTV